MTDQEINKAIAEKVMGLTVVKGFQSRFSDELYSEIPSWGNWDEIDAYRDEDGYLETIPDYCNDLNAAFEALDKLRASRLHDGLSCTIWANNEGVKFASIEDIDGRGTGSEGELTYSKALCLAILKAKGIY